MTLLSDADRRHADKIAETENGDRSDIADLHLALGRSYEAEKAYDVAFDCFRRANELLNTRLHYEKAAEQRQINELIETFTPELFRELSGIGADSDMPVFVLGITPSSISERRKTDNTRKIFRR